MGVLKHTLRVRPAMMRLVALGHGKFPRPLAPPALDGGHCFSEQIFGRFTLGHLFEQI